MASVDLRDASFTRTFQDTFDLQTDTVVGQGPQGTEIRDWANESTGNAGRHEQRLQIGREDSSFVINGKRIRFDSRLYCRATVTVTSEKRVSNINGDGLQYEVTLAQLWKLSSSTEDHLECFLARVEGSK